MALARQTKIIIAIIGGALFLFAVIGVFVWLANAGPILYRSEEIDPLSKYPKTVVLNPLRDRSCERPAVEMIAAMRDGRCREILQPWLKDYHRHYAESICQSEQQHPLVSWRLVDRQDAPPVVMLRYLGKRRDPGSSQSYEEEVWITTQQNDGAWHATKYVPMY